MVWCHLASVSLPLKVIRFLSKPLFNGIGFTDQDYVNAGAEILPTAADVFAKSEMIVKVKEPQAVERAMLREDQLLFTYLHLAPDLPQTEDLIKSGAVCIAYETVTDDRGGLPYSRQCQKWLAVCRFKQAQWHLKSLVAVAVCYWAAFRV